MGIKMIVTDLDGTLLRTDKTVSDRTIQEAVPEAEIVSAANRTVYWNSLHIDFRKSAKGCGTGEAAVGGFLL